MDALWGCLYPGIRHVIWAFVRSRCGYTFIRQCIFTSGVVRVSRDVGMICVALTGGPT